MNLFSTIRINFRFRLFDVVIATWLLCIFHKTWCRCFYRVWSYWHFFWNSRWLLPPSWNFKLGEFGTVRDIHSVAPELCTNRRPFVPDMYLMTSHELTSGFDFWSCWRLRMAVMHLSLKFGAYLYPGRSYWYFFLKLRCVDLSNQCIYFNSVWYRTQIPHCRHTRIAKFT